ncbi:MAG: helix-turn-helix transcriptional regulator [Clostridia bacterium]|nr:helix-turn-helix transcriptional regulator [Clostridia bacterium]
MNFSLNENIKRLRTQAGLNQVEFAKKMSVTKQCVSNWENDNVVPSIEMLVKLADFFKVTTDYMLGRETKNLIVADGLTEEQKAHIRLLVKDFSDINKKK